MCIASALDYWLVNPLQSVYRNSVPPLNAQPPIIEWVSALNEYESMQIALRSRYAFTVTGIVFTGAVKNNLTFHFVEYEEKATTQAENAITPWTVNMPLYPLSPTPDPLSNDETQQVEANETQPVFITHYASREMLPGLYEGGVVIQTTLGDVHVPVRVKVCHVVIPESNASSFTNYHWTMTNGFSDGLAWDKNSKPAYDVGVWYYGIETYSEEWFTLMETFADALTRYRNNMIWVRTDLFLKETGVYLSDFIDGIPGQLDWSLFDRYVEVYINRGIKRFANTHLFHALCHMPEDERPGEHWTTIPDCLPVTDRFLTHYLTALYSHLKEKGWTEENGFLWYQHIRDEPIYTEHKNHWAYVARKIKEINAATGSAYIIMDADPDGLLLDDDSRDFLDVMVPYTKGFFKRRDDFKQAQQHGKTLWVYTMEVNRPPWLNRFWIQPTLTGRLLYWNLSQEDITGHLHWAWNAWYRGPWDGDTYIVYPDKKNKTVKSSLRQEAMRDGLEDYELLQIIKTQNPCLARELAQRVVNQDNPTQYTLSSDNIKELHDYMVLAASGEEAGDIPPSPSPWLGQPIPLTKLVKNITANGAWYVKNRRLAYLGTVQATHEAGAFLAYTFIGTGVDVVVQKSAAMGVLTVQVDDKPAISIDAYEAVDYDHCTVYRNRSLSEGQHTITITNKGNGALYFDCLRVFSSTEPSKDEPLLAGLNIKGVGSFVFNRYIMDYKIVLDATAEAIELTPILADNNGTVAINSQVVGNKEPAMLPVPVGITAVTIVVTAANGATETIYRLQVLRLPAKWAALNKVAQYASITADGARAGQDGETYGPAKMTDGNPDTMYAVELHYTGAMHPFPHEIKIGWDTPQSFNTLVMAVRYGLIQGITEVDLIVSYNGRDWEAVERHIRFTWHNDDAGAPCHDLEWTFAPLPPVQGVVGAIIRINEANYENWNMYAVSALGLYDL